MALSQPSMSPLITIRRRDGWQVAFLWVGVTVVGAALASLVAWRLRALDPAGPVWVQQVVAFAVAAETQLIISTAQWLLLRTRKVNARWWVPLSVAANVTAAFVIIPPIIGLALAAGMIQPVTADGARSFGTLSLALSGLVVGIAQMFVWRSAAGKATWAWVWVPSTVIGAVLAGAVTYGLFLQLFGTFLRLGLLVPGLIGLLAAVGAFLSSACQAPVVARLLR